MNNGFFPMPLPLPPNVRDVLGSPIASAATINLDLVNGDFVHITGTTTITAITLANGVQKTIVFNGILTLTNNSTSLILPGAANITTAAGDVAIVRGDGAGNTRCVSYTLASGKALSAPAQELVLISTLTPTAAAAVNALNVFTSSYDNYLVIGEGIIPQGADDLLAIQLATAGALDTGSHYFQSTAYSATNFVTATTNIKASLAVTTTCFLNSGLGANFEILISNVNATSATQHKSVRIRNLAQTTGGPAYGACDTMTLYNQTAVVTGLGFSYPFASSNFSAQGTIRIYGIGNS